MTCVAKFSVRAFSCMFLIMKKAFNHSHPSLGWQGIWRFLSMHLLPTSSSLKGWAMALQATHCLLWNVVQGMPPMERDGPGFDGPQMMTIKDAISLTFLFCTKCWLSSWWSSNDGHQANASAHFLMVKFSSMMVLDLMVLEWWQSQMWVHWHCSFAVTKSWCLWIRKQNKLS